MEIQVIKNNPGVPGLFPTMYPRLDIPATPPSGDSSKHKFL